MEGHLGELGESKRVQARRGQCDIRPLCKRAMGCFPIWPHWEAGVAAPHSTHCSGQDGCCLGAGADASYSVSEAREDQQPTC